jgi:hypothetical protein
MSRQTKNDLKGSLIIPVGWLFADLLLALAMIFLVANTVVIPKPKPKPTPVVKVDPTPKPKPSPTSNILILEPGRVTISISNLHPDSLSTGDPTAVTDLKNKIMSWINQHGLQKRRAGIAIVYAGANSLNPNEVDRATSVAGETYKVLDLLGQQKFVFCHTVHFDALFTTNLTDDKIEIDTYFFSTAAGGC